ncbi:MAG: DEAD/DEAH box helicase, partial [Planctomycetaceae bacterium]|nr:DEAD/DEAH box helicase [Planctomycetaceae bacterium]
LFTTAFGGHFSPYPYQQRLATTTCWPQVLSVPTGVGKTAAAVLTWVYRRRFAVESIRQATPRRLVYCLPMRTLVEQTRDAATKWLERLRIDATQANGIGIHLLMGGADDGKWYEHPERDAILIGTQDMLLSRALNRGYGMSRYAWPVQYALLNNDCQWVIDETQLMGVGLTTSAQLAGLRTKLTTIGNCPTLWMSATLDVQTLATVDNPVPDAGAWTYERLEDDDRAAKSVARLLTASKPCQSAAVSLSPETKKQYEKQLAAEVLQAHQPNTLTLVVMNRVTRAQELYTAVDVLQKKAKSTVDVKLIHSRFRPYDRQKTQPEALDEDSISDAGRIIVATQAIEAGVDVSSTTLFTELAPWSSLVQRFGRCNRRGECGLECVPAASVHWIDIDTSDAKKAIEPALPYTPEELDRARTAIAVLDDVGPRSLSDVTIEEPRPIVHVLRRKDL